MLMSYLAIILHAHLRLGHAPQVHVTLGLLEGAQHVAHPVGGGQNPVPGRVGLELVQGVLIDGGDRRRAGRGLRVV